MPECHNCHTRFPNWVKVEGVLKNLSSRKYCPECSPIGRHRTTSIENDKPRECTRCGKSYTRHQTSCSATLCASCVVNKNRTDKKRKLVALKGGKCQRCGYDKSLAALQFHHRNPAEKLFTINGRNGCRSWESLLQETQKCDLLCANCHAEVHENLRLIS